MTLVHKEKFRDFSRRIFSQGMCKMTSGHGFETLNIQYATITTATPTWCRPKTFTNLSCNILTLVEKCAVLNVKVCVLMQNCEIFIFNVVLQDNRRFKSS